MFVRCLDCFDQTNNIEFPGSRSMRASSTWKEVVWPYPLLRHEQPPKYLAKSPALQDWSTFYGATTTDFRDVKRSSISHRLRFLGWNVFWRLPYNNHPHVCHSSSEDIIYAFNNVIFVQMWKTNGITLSQIRLFLWFLSAFSEEKQIVSSQGGVDYYSKAI